MSAIPATRSTYARALAMGGYGLVVASLFTVWITGLAAFVVAFLRMPRGRAADEPVDSADDELERGGQPAHAA